MLSHHGKMNQKRSVHFWTQLMIVLQKSIHASADALAKQILQLFGFPDKKQDLQEDLKVSSYCNLDLYPFRVQTGSYKICNFELLKINTI